MRHQKTAEASRAFSSYISIFVVMFAVVRVRAFSPHQWIRVSSHATKHLQRQTNAAQSINRFTTERNVIAYSYFSTQRKAKNRIFQEGEPCLVQMNGAQYEGTIQGRNGVWYTVAIPKEDGNGFITLKRRGGELTPKISGLMGNIGFTIPDRPREERMKDEPAKVEQDESPFTIEKEPEKPKGDFFIRDKPRPGEVLRTETSESQQAPNPSPAPVETTKSSQEGDFTIRDRPLASEVNNTEKTTKSSQEGDFTIRDRPLASEVKNTEKTTEIDAKPTRTSEEFLESLKSKAATYEEVDDLDEIPPEVEESFKEEVMQKEKDMLMDLISPPSLTVINLDASVLCQKSDQDQIRNRRYAQYLNQCQHFAQYDKWVMFTDLHCAPSSLNTCLKVLETVHEEAKKQNAGILFLGDFWHHRGTVRVDCLNAVLNELGDWEQPCIMIPGNHDQVSLGGLEHALTPLQNAYRVSTKNTIDKGDVNGILIFSHPTKFKEAMFIPHIREIGVMQSILQSKTSASSNALFVHADVTGAYMNDLITSSGGIAPAYFPPNVPIWSGHFHKPHTVEKPEAAPGVKIRYVGSPYETTLAEANQEKALLVLDSSKNWTCAEEIPLSIGRRHWRCKSIDEFLEIPVMNEEDFNDALTGPCKVVRGGDRVVISVQQEDLEEYRRNNSKSRENRLNGGSAFDTKVRDLRSLGVSVEVRETKSIPNVQHVGSAIDNDDELKDALDWLLIEDMTPSTTWANYLSSEVKRESMKNSTAEILLEAGNNLLEELGIPKDVNDNEADTRESNQSTKLSLDEITVEGFGPFKESTTYPLNDRGLVLLRGSNRDGGSDSNGSGKSTLAMSALWALTGSIDPRPVNDGKVGDVVHDKASSAKVTIKGMINNKEFVISRTKTASKGSLTFMLDGEDMTKQSAKETQQFIEESLGADPQVLSRTIFHGQHTMNGLLEATDAKLKEELSIIVPLKNWQDAAAKARKMARTLSQSVSEYDGMISIRKRDLEKVIVKRENADNIVASKGKTFLEMEEKIKKRLEEEVASEVSDSVDIEAIQTSIEELRKEIDDLESSLSSNFVEMKKELEPLEAERVKYANNLSFEKSELQKCLRQVDRYELSLSSACETMENLERKWGIEDSSDLSSLAANPPSVCPTCKQEIKDDEAHQHFIDEVETTMSEAMGKIEELQGLVSSSEEILKEKQLLVDVIEDQVRFLTKEMERIEDQWQGKQSEIETTLQEVRGSYSQLSNDLAQAAKNMDVINEVKTLKSNAVIELRSFKEGLTAAIENRNEIAKELEELQNSLEDIESKRENDRYEAEVMKNAADNFGARGVQTFILQNTVKALQIASQSYLDELSDGTLRLELVLDSGDRILRTVSVLNSDGVWVARPLSSLSGGQWRRCSLALSLGFADLISRRGRLCSSLLVLDEPLTHLDSSGRDSVGKLLRKIITNQSSEQVDGQVRRLGGLSVNTILIILQDLVAEELSESFDCIDEVVKHKGQSKVVVDETAQY